MNTTTEIAFILDRSSSMEAVRQAAINGFNEFLRDQQAAPGHTRLTLVLFDDQILTIHDSIPIIEVLPLDHTTFVPRGCTALLDAIGTTVDRLGDRIAATPENQRPGHVAVAILTDGEENSSCQYDWQRIARRINRQTRKYGWDFLFLGAGPDAIATASKMNIHTHNSAAYMADATGQEAASKAVSRKISAARRNKINPAQAQPDATASLDDIVREEDQKRRQ